MRVSAIDHVSAQNVKKQTDRTALNREQCSWHFIFELHGPITLLLEPVFKTLIQFHFFKQVTFLQKKLAKNKMWKVRKLGQSRSCGKKWFFFCFLLCARALCTVWMQHSQHSGIARGKKEGELLRTSFAKTCARIFTKKYSERTFYAPNLKLWKDWLIDWIIYSRYS